MAWTSSTRPRGSLWLRAGATLRVSGNVFQKLDLPFGAPVQLSVNTDLVRHAVLAAALLGMSGLLVLVGAAPVAAALVLMVSLAALFVADGVEGPSELPLSAQPPRPATGPTVGTPEFKGLLSRVGHDLRTPLNAIIGFAEIMQSEMLGPLGSPRYRSYAAHIRESGFSLLKAVEDTLVLTRLLADRGRARTGPACLDEALTGALDLIAPEAAAHEVHVLPPAPVALVVAADPHVLRQALLNVALLALSRTAPGGLMAIAATVSGGLAHIVIEITASDAPARHLTDDLTEQLARSLVALTGGSLAEDTAGRERRLVVTFPIATE
jgi:signal transduction histidine kinase